MMILIIFFLWTGNQEDIYEKCILTNNNQTLNCKNELIKNTKYLYLKINLIIQLNQIIL